MLVRATAAEPEDFTALYFPHVQIEDPELIRSSLLLWDQLHYIAPERYMLPYDEDTPRELAKALDVIAHAHVPDASEREATHELIMKVVAATTPDEWRSGVEVHRFDFGVYRGKFMYETFEELRHRGLGEYLRGRRGDDFAMNSRLGLTVMAILAACCNRVSRQAITDRTWDYVRISTAFPRVARLSRPSNEDPPQIVDRLMRASFEVIDLSNVSLERLVELRRKEDAEFTELRHGYVRTLREFVEARTGPLTSTGAANAIEAEFISQARKWVTELTKVLEVETAKKRLLQLSAASSALLAAKHAPISPGEAAMELLAAFSAYGASRFDFSNRRQVRRESPAGYLHFLSRLR